MAMSSRGTSLSKIKRYRRDKLWRLLRTALKPTIDWKPRAMEGGIPASSFKSLEEENLFSLRKQEDAGNYRLLRRLYPGIVEEYKGIAINLYAALREEAGSGGEETCLYPLVCSKNCNDPSYLQVDILKDAVELYAAQHRYARQGKKLLSNKTELGHCFLLTDLSEVLHRNVGSRQRSRLRKQEQLC
jgi:hypothetical protein